MIVYAESNFVLELALLQKEHQSCQKILSFEITASRLNCVRIRCSSSEYR
jgi:hypothetical protein